MTTTIIVLSDPLGGEEPLGRLLNALAAAYDLKQRGRSVQIVFQGTGTRWPALLSQPKHPAHGLFQTVEDKVLGVSSACADFFGTRADAQAGGLALMGTNEVPGTSGLPSIADFAADGPVVTF